ncbi:acyl-CoA carboxylase subunit epsilon [Rhodoluna lacicola]|jgi:hypothetical protein|uniref:Acyl-CoA carboxylase epsilon subunit n=1 Tax=Rhodoluna lacicola TaxID=529884 RepID=A0A060JDH6_9MICO|nr:acyl-CoA carboxylase subunit epsilon [Rhodoluna lacicola]AIC47926.1 hypothetical protein Rhola_00011330 [Rhodoluna lacicola]
MTEFSESIQVVSGAPTPEELATVIAVLEAAHAEEEATATGYERPLKSSWSRNVAQLRHPIVPGPGQWRGAYRSGLN